MELVLRGTVFGVAERRTSGSTVDQETGEVREGYDYTQVGFVPAGALDVVRVKIDHQVPGVPRVPVAGDEVEWIVQCTPYRDGGRARLSIKALREASAEPMRAAS